MRYIAFIAASVDDLNDIANIDDTAENPVIAYGDTIEATRKDAEQAITDGIVSREDEDVVVIVEVSAPVAVIEFGKPVFRMVGTGFDKPLVGAMAAVGVDAIQRDNGVQVVNHR